MTETSAWIGIGANLGQPERAIARAIKALRRSPGIQALRVSPLYRSAPVDLEDQPPFINAVAQARVCLDPHALLAVLQGIENDLGRRRDGPRFGPRIIDLDLLLYGERIMNDDRLIVPHPRMHRRRFVLEPLAALAPELVIPGHGRVADLLDACRDQEVVRLDPDPTRSGC